MILRCAVNSQTSSTVSPLGISVDREKHYELFKTAGEERRDTKEQRKERPYGPNHMPELCLCNIRAFELGSHSLWMAELSFMLCGGDEVPSVLLSLCSLGIIILTEVITYLKSVKHTVYIHTQQHLTYDTNQVVADYCPMIILFTYYSIKSRQMKQVAPNMHHINHAHLPVM